MISQLMSSIAALHSFLQWRGFTTSRRCLLLPSASHRRLTVSPVVFRGRALGIEATGHTYYIMYTAVANILSISMMHVIWWLHVYRLQISNYLLSRTEDIMPWQLLTDTVTRVRPRKWSDSKQNWLLSNCCNAMERWSIYRKRARS